MLGEILNLGAMDASLIFDNLYKIFSRDFVEQKIYLKGKIWIDPQSHRRDNGKEAIFWHLVTKKDRKSTDKNDRYLDYDRASRLCWIRPIIENPVHDCIKAFYHKETNEKLRLYLWAKEHDFVVIIQKLGKRSAFLVTSFYVDHIGKRKSYQDRLEYYQSGVDEDLNSCNWF